MSRTSRHERLLETFVAAAIVLPGLALGAIHPEAVAALAGVSAALLALLAFVTRRDGRGVPLDLGATLLLGLAAFTVLQLLPLPAALVAIVSPEAHEIRSRALFALGAPPPGFMPLTLDASMTSVELAKLLSYFAVYESARRVSERRGPDAVYTAVVAAGGVAAAVFLAHRILGLDRVYGLYAPVHFPSWAGELNAPLINANHLSALLGMGAALAVGRAVSIRERGRKAAAIAAAAIVGGAVFLTLSRGGMAAFALGQILFVVSRALASRVLENPERRGSSAMLLLPIGLALSFGLALFAAEDAVLGELANHDTSKIQMAKEALPLAGSFPWTGVGRGAFWVGFSRVSDWDAQTTFTHAENAAVQLLVDYGFIVGSIALAGFAFVVLRRLVRPDPHPSSTAAACALVALGIHNLVDFNTEIPGVACVAVALLGALAAADPDARGHRGLLGALSRTRFAPPWTLYALAAGSAISALGVGFLAAPHQLDREERALHGALQRREWGAFAPSSLAPILERHPAAWYPPFLAGVARFHDRKESPLPFLGRALELNPYAGQAHFYVGRELLLAGKLDQALFEFGLAARFKPDLASPAAQTLARAVPRFDAIQGFARTRDEKKRLWPLVAEELSRAGHDDEAEKADKALIALFPTESQAVARHARRLISRGDQPAAMPLIRGLSEPQDVPIRAILETELYLSQKEPKKAVAAVERALRAHPENESALLPPLARARAEAGDVPGALEIVSKITARASNDAELASAHILDGEVKLTAGRVREALAAFARAAALSPNDVLVLRRIADIAESTGDAARAVDALRRLEALDPRNALWKKRRETLETSRRIEHLMAAPAGPE